MTKAGCTLLGAGIVAAFSLGVWAGGGISPQEPEIALTGSAEKVDTVYVCDTITREMPVYRVSRVTDTIRVHTSDTVRIVTDSTVEIVREQRVYEDSTYRAVVSGYRPSLDTIAVYPRHSVVTLYSNNVVQGQKKRWGLGVQAGYGVTGDGLSPFIGVGINYNILTW